MSFEPIELEHPDEMDALHCKYDQVCSDFVSDGACYEKRSLNDSRRLFITNMGCDNHGMANLFRFSYPSWSIIC